MPENHDPITLLETLDVRDLDVTPLDPREVRRLGDRRRHRRHAALVAAAAAVVAVVAVPIALTFDREGGRAAPAPLTAGPAPVVVYPGNGVEVHDSTQVDRLRGAPADFKAFVGALADRLAQESGDQCGPAGHGVTVTKVTDDGYALGAVNECGGYVALWVRADGRWKEALGTQDEWRCGDLARFDVPRSFAGECYGPAAAFGPVEDLGLRLGMSAEAVVAAGGTVIGPAGACQGVVPRGETPPKDATLGYLSAIPAKGVVALFAGIDQVTPEGIGDGSSRSDVEQAYPDGHFDEMKGAWIVPIDERSHYRFDLDHDAVRQISLESEGPQDCYE